MALAQQVGVDKSLVGRWVKGTIHPGEHNLARLTTVFREYFPDITLADWYEDRAEMARRIGIVFHGAAPLGPDLLAEGPFAKMVEASKPEMEFRAPAYEGFWRTTRPSVMMPDQLFHDYGIFRIDENGMLDIEMEGSGLHFTGWMLPMSGNVYVFLFDPVGRTPLIVLMKGVTLPRAITLEGLLLLSALDSGRTPAALPILVERLGDLSGDHEADKARLRKIIEEKPDPIDPVSDEDRDRLLFRDVGPAAAAAGGSLYMAVGGAFSRGTTTDGLKG
ncbi:hypothetical protein [Croceicoccus naphthovorans]|uniref:hypothetical protein n=1 Tax=Croceicoccus naphthovorans TaxID=1348774 RepID=UPI0012E01AE6|nr:hypothetical protein [Croceicoccus naphthovorans]